MHLMAIESAKYGDWAKSGCIKVTILPESNGAVVSLPLALTGVTGEALLSSAQYVFSNPQGRLVTPSLAAAEGIDTLRLGQIQAICPGSPHS